MWVGSIRLGKHRYWAYITAQFLGCLAGAITLKLALPPALDETPFTTTGSLTFEHPFQVRNLFYLTVLLIAS